MKKRNIFKHLFLFCLLAMAVALSNPTGHTTVSVVMANAPENIGLMEEMLVWKAYGKIDVTADKTGETTIVEKLQMEPL